MFVCLLIYLIIQWKFRRKNGRKKDKHFFSPSLLLSQILYYCFPRWPVTGKQTNKRNQQQQLSIHRARSRQNYLGRKKFPFKKRNSLYCLNLKTVKEQFSWIIYRLSWGTAHEVKTNEFIIQTIYLTFFCCSAYIVGVLLLVVIIIIIKSVNFMSYNSRKKKCIKAIPKLQN